MFLLRACNHILNLCVNLEISGRSEISAHPSVTYWFRPDRVKLRRMDFMESNWYWFQCQNIGSDAVQLSIYVNLYLYNLISVSIYILINNIYLF